jgi:hypothetical protein
MWLGDPGSNSDTIAWEVKASFVKLPWNTTGTEG